MKSGAKSRIYDVVLANLNKIKSTIDIIGKFNLVRLGARASLYSEYLHCYFKPTCVSTEIRRLLQGLLLVE